MTVCVVIGVFLGACTSPGNTQKEGRPQTARPEDSSDTDDTDVPDSDIDGEEQYLPVAVVNLRAADPLDPAAPYTEADTIEPLQRIYLDGRGSYHSSPGGVIVDYDWTVTVSPAGTDPTLFVGTGQGTGLYSFVAPLPGAYRVSLKVTDNAGISSGTTDNSFVDFVAVPRDALHIQLV